MNLENISKEASYKGPHILGLCLYELSRIRKFSGYADWWLLKTGRKGEQMGANGYMISFREQNVLSLW